MVATESVWRVGQMDEGGLNVLTSSYKINMSLGYDIQMVMIINSTILHILNLLRK